CDVLVFYTIIMLFLFCSSTEGCCPPEWTALESSCYYFSNVSLSWNDSRDWCETRQAHLVILRADKEWVRQVLPYLRINNRALWNSMTCKKTLCDACYLFTLLSRSLSGCVSDVMFPVLYSTQLNSILFI
uniref:C-type lectin domain-containing protein n=1 Tax=Amphilophus citrinellus TaxID=61819 RepID=A0A3Q0SYT1_AMPCI